MSWPVPDNCAEAQLDLYCSESELSNFYLFDFSISKKYVQWANLGFSMLSEGRYWISSGRGEVLLCRNRTWYRSNTDPFHSPKKQRRLLGQSILGKEGMRIQNYTLSPLLSHFMEAWHRYEDLTEYGNMLFKLPTKFYQCSPNLVMNNSASLVL